MPFAHAFQIEIKIVIVIANARWKVKRMTASWRKIFKAIVIASLLLAICLLFTASLASVNSRKSSLDDSDLIFVRPQIPAESNAFYTLLKATNEIYWPDKLQKKLKI
jgi:hypothetical protein